MFGEFPHQPVAPDQQGERFDDRGFAGVVGAGDDGMSFEADGAAPDAAEILDGKIRNPHPKSILGVATDHSKDTAELPLAQSS